MENAVYIGLSQQMAMQHQMDVIANNIANADTPAYRSERVLFQEYLMDNGPGQTPLSYVQDYGLLRDTSEGEIKETGNPLDIALNGKGYFEVSTAEGMRYSRDGHLTLNTQGDLSTADGDPLLDTQNQPIFVDPRDGAVTIATDGTISNSSGQIGQLKLVRFASDQKMQNVGNTLYTTDQTPAPATGLVVEQGMIEGSNVRPIVQMTRMVQLLRNYQAAQQLLNVDHSRQTNAMSDLAKVS